MSFKHLNRGSKGYRGQRSPIIVQGHRKSPSAKSKKMQYLICFSIFAKPEVCNISLKSSEIISSFKFLVSMVTYFWPNLMKCPKIGSNSQIFASLLAEKIVFNHVKHIIILKETLRNGVI